jgi:hypothetical protein
MGDAFLCDVAEKFRDVDVYCFIGKKWEFLNKTGVWE